MERCRLIVENRPHHVVDHLAGKGLPIREQFVDDEPDGKDVAAAIHRPSLDLLRRHVMGRTNHRARLGQAGVGDPRDAEIQNPQDAIQVDHDVGGLDVPVHDAFLMRVVEPQGELFDQIELASQRQGSPLPNLFGEREALDELHHDVRLTVLVAEIVDRDDVAVFQVAGRLRLLKKAVAQPLIGGAKELDRDGAANPGIATAIDPSHAAVPEAVDDLVPTNRAREL